MSLRRQTKCLRQCAFVRATSDLDSIHEHYASLIGPDAANAVLAQIIETLEQLQTFTGLGRPLPNTRCSGADPQQISFYCTVPTGGWRGAGAADSSSEQ
ncbi:type II toxin-antitoxin system RelE/ParE family toxin [Pseudomonas psychrophila]|uniref:type II toxin-antitoxin system RelE/ParE family toxin n=1 Tax=Pseudomonas psychrophila TaxID=122355 RepID=UPI001ED934FE|nr:type II toxin-antitoxin system RelE/ParE family toxin [Pseudomonas psychrophila]